VRLTDREAAERAARIESLLGALEAVGDPARSVAIDALKAVMDLYGEALARLAAHVAPETLAADEVVAHVLLLHGLHPVDVDARVANALAALRGSLGAQGAAVDLAEIAGGVARVRIRGGGRGCSAMTARREVEDAIRRAAPDLERLEVELEESPPPLIAAESIKLRPSRAGSGSPAAA